MKNIPVLHVQAKTLAETYEKAMLELYKNGIQFKTQYDKPGDPESLDCTMNMTVEEPETDPMIHKCFPGGFEDLREYVYELMGLKDNWIKVHDDPKDTRWEYLYSQRITKWGSFKVVNPSTKEEVLTVGIDQVKTVLDKLTKQPFTRQAQMITWDPRQDSDCYDPPCLQSIWYRVLEDEGTNYLNCNVRFRSNDSFGANMMNMFGFVQFNRLVIADELQKRYNKPVKLGRMNWQADSFHIYGKDIADAKKRLFDRIKNSTFEERVYNFYDEDIQCMYYDCEEYLLNKFKETEKTFIKDNNG